MKTLKSRGNHKQLNWKKLCEDRGTISYFNRSIESIYCIADGWPGEGWVVKSHIGNTVCNLIGTKTHILGRFSTKSKARAFMLGWMRKHPRGVRGGYGKP